MATYVRLPERVKQAEALAEANGGTLPRPSSLKQSNPQLMQAIVRRPDAFKHIPREGTIHRTPQQWVELAEEIAKKNGGFLPTNKDLREEHGGLASYIYRNKAAFDHIKRAEWTNERREKLAKFVKEAEQLAAENDGFLNLSREFQVKYSPLACVMRTSPEAFAHIPRVHRKTKTLEEHVSFAKQLAAENDGLLPPVSVIKAEYPALRTMMQTHPESFKDIPRESLTTTAAEYADQARKLAADNGGILQAGTWLHKNGYRNLESAMHRKPEAFKGIEQEVLNAQGKRVRTKIL